jgi:glutamate---cysteine ligase / carboxylate-amine ligase
MEKERIYFNNSEKPTIGVEVELLILNKDTLELYPGAPVILDVFKNSENVKQELLNSIVEINTNICNDVKDVRKDLTKTIGDVVKVAEDNGWSLMSMGTHPFSRWKDQSITDKERYMRLIDRYQWPARRLLITGVHVHIGVESGEKSIAITNGLLRYLPHMIAISANSPIYDSKVSGLASTRTKLFEGMPTTGLPHVLKNYSEFQKFMRTLITANTIDSIREVWWDIRPHPGFGTVEIRAFDAVPSINEMVNLAAFTQCLVVGISDHYDEGTQLPILDSWINSENKWRATRYGLDAEIVVDDIGHPRPLQAEIIRTIDQMLPIANKINCVNEMLNLRKMVENRQIPYLRQLKMYEEHKDFKPILQSAVKELREGLQ